MGSKTKIVLFGDSITQRGFDVQQRGWVASLSHAYTRKADVINRGYSGYNTRWALKVLPIYSKDIMNMRDKIKLVTIFFGANDAALADRCGQHVPVAEYKMNLGKILDSMSSTLNDCAFILISPPPVDEDSWKEYQCTPESNRTLEQSELYSKACSEVAHEKGTFFVDVWQAIMNSDDWKGCLCDGLHLSGKGNDIVYEELYKTIETNMKHLLPDALSVDAPLYDQIDADNYEASFKEYM